MAYALSRLLRIRLMREDRAGTELTGARRAQSVAEKAREEKERERRDFDATKEKRRDRIYDAVMGRVISQDQLSEARSAVTRIDEQSFLLGEAERKATEARDKAASEAESARVRYVVAAKNRTKIDEHRRSWEEEDRREQERLADAEMEEFTGRRLVADDDDSLD